MTAPVHHSLTIVDRGREHRHRFKPECVCQWAGIPVRTKKSAAREYHDHVRAARRSGNNGRRRRITPAERLPEALR